MFTNPRIYYMTKTLNAAVVVALANFECQRFLVTAQSFTNCALDVDDPYYTLCEWSVSPLSTTDTFTTYVLYDSTLYSVCNTGGSFTTADCTCGLYIDDGTGVFDVDNYCNSCTFLDLSVTSFFIQWDCSNRAVGSNCAILDSNGCRAADNPTPFPVQAPTNFPMSQPPTLMPVKAPTPSPITVQSFTNCTLALSDPDCTLCYWSVSPLSVYDQFTTFVLNDSTLVSICNTGGSFTTANCTCGLYIDDGTGVFDDDNYCNSCTFLDLSVYDASIYWNCSNRAAGSGCAIYDSNGCQTGNEPTSFPVLSPTNFLMSQPPTLTPVKGSTSQFSNAPIQSPNSSTESDNSLSSTSGGSSSTRYYHTVVVMSSFVLLLVLRD